MDVKTFSTTYIKRLIHLLETIDTTVVDAIINALEKTIQNKSRIYILGNGGSAATASHMANDLGAAGLRRRRIRNFDVISLSDNSAVITAIANDIGYENIFYMQMEGLLKSEDLIIAISCSGNSENIVKASQYAKSTGCTLVGVTGFDGGKIKAISDISFHIDTPAGEYGLVEDLHMILDHIIYSYYLNLEEMA